MAVASLEAASTRNPDSAEVQRILGMALALAGQQETSLTHLRESLRLNPQDERSRIAIADVLIASGKPDAALESLRETLRVMPESAEKRPGKSAGSSRRSVMPMRCDRSSARRRSRSSPDWRGSTRSSARPITRSSISTAPPRPTGSACELHRTIAMRTSISLRSIVGRTSSTRPGSSISRRRCSIPPMRRRSACSVRSKPQPGATKKRSPCCAAR